MAANMGQISAQFKELLGQLGRQNQATPNASPPAHPEVLPPSGGSSCKLAPPTQYAGEPGLCRTFLIDCSIHFAFMPQAFLTDRAKVAFMISHLTGGAKAWVSAEWSRHHCRISGGTNQDFRPRVYQPREGSGTQLAETRNGFGMWLCHSVSHSSSREWMEQCSTLRHILERFVGGNPRITGAVGFTHQPGRTHRSRYSYRQLTKSTQTTSRRKTTQPRGAYDTTRTKMADPATINPRKTPFLFWRGAYAARKSPTIPGGATEETPRGKVLLLRRDR